MILEVRDLFKSFGEKKVLEGIQLYVEGGRALGLLGRNGAGKTTTIRIIMDVFPPDSGEVLCDGGPINRKQVAIGYLPEEHGLYPKIEITEQLIYLGKLRGMKAKDARAAIAKWMKRLEVDEYAKRRLETLSKGNQQKVQLVATLISNPDIVILDEPFSGLDPVNAALLKDVVKEIIKEGKIVLFSSHQMNYVEEFCDNIAILHNGKIALAGAINDIKRSYDRNVLVVRSLQKDAIMQYCLNDIKENIVTASMHRDYLKVTLKAVEQKGAFMAALHAKGFDLDSIGVYEPSLNDIFVQYTGEEPQAEGGKAQ
ncbi:MAG: ATP-binding cassette domain-containing protein [Oscillospiraceae bacterium]|nr:ATP-binding cassette domain-containing protein [Oscillospiraceae bacterium]